jgi:Uncharacterised protein family (UPF0175)
MQITVDPPDDIASTSIQAARRSKRWSSKGIAPGALTHHQASPLVGMNRFEFDDFLKARGIYDHAYGIEDLRQDLETLRRLETKGLIRRP